MTIIWKPIGTLDLSTDPCELQQSGSGADIGSGAMQRCKNLRLDENGVAKTRDGSRIIDSGLTTPINLIIEQAGSRYSFAGHRIYQDSTSIESGLSDAKWSAMLYNAFNDLTQDIFALNGTDRKRIENGTVYEWGIAAPTTTPVAATGTTTGLTGDYSFKYTFARKSGSTIICESNPSSASNTVTAANQSITVTIDLSLEDLDLQITHIRMYRTLTSGLIYYHDGDVEVPAIYGTDYSFSYPWEETYASNNDYLFATNLYNSDYRGTFTWEPDLTATTYQYNMTVTSAGDVVIIWESLIADTALGTEVETDHDRPPAGTYVVGPNYNGTCFIIHGNNLYYCDPKQPEYWPVLNYIEVSPIQFPGQAACFWNGQLYLFTKTEIYLIQGTGTNTFFPLAMSAITGAQGQDCIAPVAGRGIYHVGSDGIYLFNGQVDKKVSQSQLERIFRGETVNTVPGVKRPDSSWLIQFNSKLYFGYIGDNDYPDNVIVYDMDTEKGYYFNYGIQISALGIDKSNTRLLAGDTAGNVWELENRNLPDDGGTPISWEVQAKDFTLQTRAHFPRWVKYDIDASNPNCLATGYLLLDDVSAQSHAITGTRQTRKRLVATSNGKRLSIRISGSGDVKIYMVETE